MQRRTRHQYSVMYLFLLLCIFSVVFCLGQEIQERTRIKNADIENNSKLRVARRATPQITSRFEDEDDDRHDHNPDDKNPPDVTNPPTRSPVISTPSPTMAPTFSPTKAPTSAPTPAPKVPTPSPTAPPTATMQPTCDGVNIVTGTMGNSGNLPATVLRYKYAIETDPNSSASMMGDIIPALEMKMLKVIGRNYMTPQCSESRGGIFHISHRTGAAAVETAGESAESNTAMQALSSEPNDNPMGQACDIVSADSDCTMMQGRMSYYVDGEPSLFGPEILQKIKDGMLNDEFVDAHPAIQKISFVPDDVFAPTSSPTSTSPESEDPDGEPNGGLMAVYVALGAASLVTLFVAGRAVNKRRNGQAIHPGAVEVNSDSGGVSISSLKDLGNFEHTSAHDLDTVRVANKGLNDETEVNVDMESLESKESQGQNNFDFFDLILENSSSAQQQQQQQQPTGTVQPTEQVRNRGLPEENAHPNADDMSEISF